MSKLSQFLGGVGGGGGMPTEIASEDSTAPENTNLGINTSEGSVTITLPSDPEPGDRVVFFDAALTWDEHNAIINTSGARVQYNDSTLDTFKLMDKSGVLELLYISHETGWVDVTYYKTQTDPHWFGAHLENGGQIFDTRLLGSPTLEKTFETSGEFEIIERGAYAIGLAGGAGGSTSNSNLAARSGGSTELRLNQILQGFSKGGRGSKSSTYPRLGPTFTVSTPRYIPYYIPVKNDILLVEIDTDTDTDTADGLAAPTLLGIPSFTRSAGSGTYRGEGTTSAYLYYYLEEGDMISVTIGAGGAGGSSNTLAGESGLALIYKLDVEY